ncbi:hypothetical protein LCGC14_1309990 [marine sediment metagenome]|uniref:histidine kinase n=1 Tax=marine sediment metagenome TaxID=412755 RepID=A0A0F9KN71_9ZZZZ
MRFKRQLSLKLSIALTFLLLGVVIVVGYSMLSINFFFKGMDNIISATMENVAKTYIESTVQPKNPSTKIESYTVTESWQEQPETIKSLFKEPKEFGVLHKKRVRKDQQKRTRVMFFLIKLQIKKQTFYVSREFNGRDASPLVGKNARENRQLIIVLSIVITAALALLIWLLMKWLSQPVSRLTSWTKSLTPETLKLTPPNFSYPELNDMAALVKASLSSVNESMEREQRFLRYTSHELRTPISVIRNNIELMHKIQQKHQISLPDKQLEIIDRIDRASLNMQHLCETLLWLNKDNLEQLPSQPFDVADLIHHLVDEMRYLLKNKPVTMTLDTHSYSVTHSMMAARIIIGNLIRNAFQHTWEGTILIKQHGTEIIVSNHCSQFNQDTPSDAQGFGLGLQLTEQLCEKLHWQYDNQAQLDGHKAVITISAQLR